jgi:hypothetical protein
MAKKSAFLRKVATLKARMDGPAGIDLSNLPYKVYIGAGWDNYSWVYAPNLQEAEKIAKERYGSAIRVEEDTT